MIKRRSLLPVAAALLSTRPVLGQEAWPNRPMRFIIGASAGGASDILVRMMEIRLRERLGQPLVLEPRAGAGGMVGAEVTARSAPDGYTFFINHIASHGIGPSLYRRLSFDPLRDVPGIARIAAMPNVLIVKADIGVHDVRDLVALIRAEPHRGSFASAGAGTSSHLSGILFGKRMGLEVTHVPYRGTAPSMAAVMNGEVLFAIDNAPASRQQVQAGMLRALAVSTATRASTMPDLPTLQEEGVPDFDVASWYGIAAPAGVPPIIVERLGSELVAAVRDPQVAARFRDFGAEPAPLGPVEYNAYMRGEVVRWAPLVKESGVTVD